MKKLVFISIIALLTIGCMKLSLFNSTPPEISNDSEYFENEYFSIKYPKGWVLSVSHEGSVDPLNEGDHIGGKPVGNYFRFLNKDFQRQYLQISIEPNSQPSNTLSSNEINVLVDNFILGLKENLKRKLNMTNVSLRKENIQFDSLPATKIEGKGSNDKESVATHTILLLPWDNYSCSVTYMDWNDYSPGVVKRMGEVVNSIQIKSK